MSHSILDELERAWRVFNEGKAEEALQIIIKLEKQEDISQEYHLKCKIAEGMFNNWSGKFGASLDLSNMVYEESLNYDNPFLSIDANLIKWCSFYWLGRLDQSSPWEIIRDCERLLNSAPKELISEFEKREAIIYFLKAWAYALSNDYDLALENGKKCIELFERYNDQLYLLVACLRFIGEAYTSKGELKKGLKYQKRCIKLSIENIFVSRIIKAGSFYGIGQIYYQLGDLDKAFKYFKNALETFGDIHGLGYVGYTYEKLIKLSLDKDLIEQANEYLAHFQKYIEKQEVWAGGWLNKLTYKLSEARILKASTRTRKWTEAERFLKEVIEEYDFVKVNYEVSLPVEFPDAILELCNLYLQELHITNDLEIIEEIHPYIKRLIIESERTNSYSLQAMIYLLQGKLALLQVNMGDARRHLTKAQKIAEEKGLQLLAQAISKEHDGFLVQWEGFKNRNTPISERIKLINLDETMERMQGKRALENKEQINEDPVLLLIMIEGGVLLFSYPFSDKWDRDNELFGSFMSAFTSFSDEFFSEGLDRVKFGQYTVILEILEQFSICYVFKGHSYLAKQKLTRFANRIKNHSSIMETFDRFYQTSQVMEIKDYPFLEVFITEIFQPSSQISETL